MAFNVTSEIGRLRRVLIHRPGQEIDWMVPSMMERLLFDDILYGEGARQEHDAFRSLLEAAGVETFDPQELLVQVLGEEAVRERLLERLQQRGASDEQRRHLAELAAPALASSLVTGALAGDENAERFYDWTPIPNYFFQRDPQVVLGDRVVISSMATRARDREPLLAQTVFESHPALSDVNELIDVRAEGVGDGPRTPYLEGGDVLVPSPEVLLVGLSERTNRRGVETLARCLRQRETSFRHMLVVELPARRSYMHLDTVLTFIDHGLCLAYLPVIPPGGTEAGDVYRIDLGARELSYTLCDGLRSALSAVGIDVELVPCGGSRRLIDQQREQWTDGANAFALAPGVIVTYRRNRRTTEELARRGWRVVAAGDIIAGRESAHGHGPTVITLIDNELSRARGGPRCMTMPLERDPLPSPG
ncbi:MAG: arginine deiminase family protein [Acidobacteriota bacterium]